MNGCVYRTADNQCQKYSDPVRNTMSWCVGNEPCEGRTPSNADRIRSMTDEKLADFLWHRDIQIVERASKAVGFNYSYDEAECKQNIKDWLKAPVEEVQDG